MEKRMSRSATRTNHRARHCRAPLDAALSIVDDTIIGVGFGGGADEAELGPRQPVGRATGQAQRREARDANVVEPHETPQLAAAVRIWARRGRR